MRRDEIPVVKSYAEHKVKEERKKWTGLVNDIKDEIKALEHETAFDCSVNKYDDEVNAECIGELNGYIRSLKIIDKHLGLLMNPSEESVDSDEDVMEEIKSIRDRRN